MAILVEILWEDANILHGWNHEAEGRTAMSLSVGYLLKETEKEVQICAGLGLEQTLCILAIPKSSIHKIVKRKSRIKGWG